MPPAPAGPRGRVVAFKVAPAAAWTAVEDRSNGQETADRGGGGGQGAAGGSRVPVLKRTHAAMASASLPSPPRTAPASAVRIRRAPEEDAGAREEPPSTPRRLDRMVPAAALAGQFRVRMRCCMPPAAVGVAVC